MSVRPIRTLEVEEGTWLFAPRFARDGALLLTTARVGDKHALFAWDTRTWTRVWGSELGSSGTLVVGHDETWVATSDSERIGVWDLSTGRWRGGFAGASLRTHAALPGHRLATLLDTPLHRPDGTTVDEGTRLVIFDAEVGEILSHFGLHARVTDVVTDADGARAIAVHAPSQAPGFSVWDLAERRRLMSFAGWCGPVSFRPRSSEIVLAGSTEDGYGPVLLDSGGAKLAVLEGAGETLAECHASAMSPDGQWLVTVHGDQPDNHWFRDQRLVFWDLERRCHRRTLAIDWQGWPQTVTFTREGRVLGVATYGGLTVWDIDPALAP